MRELAYTDMAVTVRPVEDWTKRAPDLSDAKTNGEPRIDALPTDRNELMASLERLSSASSWLWPQQSVARNLRSWRRGLNHPDVNICGPMHAAGRALRAADVVPLRTKLHLQRSSL